MGEHGIKYTDYDLQHRNTQGDNISTIVFRLLWQTVQDAGGRCCNDIKKKKKKKSTKKLNMRTIQKYKWNIHVSNYFHKENQPTAVCFITMINLLATMNLFALSFVNVLSTMAVGLWKV